MRWEGEGRESATVVRKSTKMLCVGFYSQSALISDIRSKISAYGGYKNASTSDFGMRSPALAMAPKMDAKFYGFSHL
jgi:hypothetical protein